MYFRKSTGRRGRPTMQYACTTRRERGEEACSNRYGAPAKELTDAIVASLTKGPLNPTTLAAVTTQQRKAARRRPRRSWPSATAWTRT